MSKKKKKRKKYQKIIGLKMPTNLEIYDATLTNNR